MNQKPFYYDGSGKLNFTLPVEAKNSVIVKPEIKEVPVVNVENKPFYYDGSGKLNF